ncbi:hypothetical protein FQN60_002278, partial [Etheostoma spectabile]
MAVSCSNLCSHLSLTRLCGLRTNRITNGLYFPYVSCQSRLPLCRHYSSSKVRRGIGRYVASSLQRRQGPGEIQMSCSVYCTVQSDLLFRDARDVQRIKAKMFSDQVEFKDLPYREMEKLRQAVPLVVISIPPFANYLVFVLMYFFPRQLLIPHFWTPQQKDEFQGLYHTLRARHHRPVLKGLESTSQQVKDGQLQSRLKHLCATVQSGANPEVSEILARLVSPLLFLTPHLPGFLLGRRLNSHGLVLLQLDRALSRLGPHQLNDSELRKACYVRGLHSSSLGINQCREWLSQWLQVSSSLK